jgi:striatin 1/3/4
MNRCLQEITYLTSPGALNPLPPRPPIEINEPQPEAALGPIQQKVELPTRPSPELMDRPTKSLPERALASKLLKPNPAPEPPEKTESAARNEEQKEAERILPSVLPPRAETITESHPMAIETTARPPSSPAVQTRGLPDELPSEDRPVEDEEKQMLTAIYRPDSKAAWREELRAANEKAERVRSDKAMLVRRLTRLLSGSC